MLIVVTGGVVRLTGSGLGCPTWPKCTEESLVTVPEMGIHGIIEFANRLLTFVLLIIAVGALVSLYKSELRVGSRWPAWSVLAGIFAQAVLGGITVKVKLNPWVVGAHFMLSAVMIVLATVFVWRVYRPIQEPVPYATFLSSLPLLLVGFVTVIIGVLVTGAGPHSGDANSERNGLDLGVWQHYHSYPGYLMLTLNLVAYLAIVRAEGFKVRGGGLTKRILGILLLVSLVQIAIGVAQARLGVPPLLVGFHLLGATALISLLTFQWLAIRSKPLRG